MLWRASLVVLALAACRAPPPKPSPSPSPSIVVGGIPNAKAVTEPEPIALTPPADVACTFAPKDLALAIALDGEAPSFAWIGGVMGTLAVATGPAARGAFLEHAARGVHLRGFVHSPGLDLFVKRPVLFSGWLVPRSGTRLRWISGEPGALELRLDINLLRDGRLTTVTFHELPRAVVPCADVGLADPDDYDSPVFLLRGRKGTSQYLRVGEAIPIALEPGRPPVADVQFTYADSGEVTVVERRGAWALVIADAWPPATLYGWVADAFFTAPPTRLVGGHHTRAPTVRQGVTELRNRRRVTCEKAVRVVAEAAGRRAYVGEIDAGNPIVFFVDDRNDRLLDLDLEGAHPDDRARLAVERSAISACRTLGSSKLP